MKKCLIISGGEFSPLPDSLTSEYFAEGAEKPLVIACDRGYEYAERLGIVPDIIVGDFDSAPEPVTDIPIIELPTRKDDTDTMKAARVALEKGCRDISICCALGGRMDHSIANMQTGAFIVSEGGLARILGRDTEILVLCPGEYSIPRMDGWSLSLFALSDAVEGLSIEGCKFSGRGYSLSNRFPLGASNVWEEESAGICFSSGILMIVISRLKPGEHI